MPPPTADQKSTTSVSGNDGSSSVAAAVAESPRVAQCNVLQPGTAVQYPELSSTAFLEQCRALFAALDVKQYGVIEERLCIQLMDRCGGPTPFGCAGGAEQQEERASWARALMRRVLHDAERLTYRSKEVDHRGRRVRQKPGATTAAAALNGSLQLPFDAFCMYMLTIVRE